MTREVPIVAAQSVDSADGDLLVLWVRRDPEDDEDDTEDFDLDFDDNDLDW